MTTIMGTEFYYWGAFCSIVIILISLDLGILNKNDNVISLKRSLSLTGFYIAIACLFGVYIYFILGADKSREYFTGFLLEKAMSLDNIFIMSIIFSFFKIPLKYQHRVLFWGILGVIIMRAIMILAGAALLTKFNWILFVFGGVLIYTGIKTLYFTHQESLDVGNLYIYKLLQSRLNIQSELDGNKFIVKKEGKNFYTPLFMALISIETMDLIFAIDSIPAIFAITKDPFIVYSSNIFAILGLRAMFFCLADIVKRFKYLKHALALILIFIGIKIFAAHFIIIPAYIPLLITVGLILLGIILSIT